MASRGFGEDNDDGAGVDGDRQKSRCQSWIIGNVRRSTGLGIGCLMSHPGSAVNCVALDKSITSSLWIMAPPSIK